MNESPLRNEENITVPQRLRFVADEFQAIHTNIIKLVLKKTLRSCRGIDKRIESYNYFLTNEAIGWRDDSITAVKVISKSLRAKKPVKYLNLKQTRECCAFKVSDKCCTIGSPRMVGEATKSRHSIAKAPSTYFSPLSVFRRDCAFFRYAVQGGGCPLTSLITNGDICTATVAQISYTDIYRQLECIGQDIINETDFTLSEEETAILSTANLRLHLFNLNAALCRLDDNIYDGVIDLIHLINSINCNQLIGVISLIAILTEVRWECLTECVKDKLICQLGEEFINEFLANEVITILLQSHQSDLILELAYGYSVFKLLYIIFGYGMITPILRNCNGVSGNSRTLELSSTRKSKCVIEKETRYDNYRRRFAGARQQHVPYTFEERIQKEECERQSEECRNESECESECDNESISSISTDSCPPSIISQTCSGSLKTKVCNDSVKSSCSNRSSDGQACSDKVEVERCEPVIEREIILPCEPLKPCVVAHISVFITLYRNLNRLMVYDIPECYPYLNCDMIPPNYHKLPSIATYLRRYFNYSYCFNQEYNDILIQQNDVSRSVTRTINGLRIM